MEISHVWEDLVFVNHTGFLLQFATKGSGIWVHSNEEATEHELQPLIDQLKIRCQAQGLMLENGHQYRLSQAADEQINLEFIH